MQFYINAGGNGAILKKKVQLIFVGDSITYGIGTTGYGASGSGIQGANSYPQQVYGLLNKTDYGFLKFGYPGQTADWYLNSGQFNTDSQLIDLSADIIIVAVFFGANSISNGDTQNDYNNIVKVHQRFKTLNAKIKTITLPVLNRIDRYSNSQTDPTRNAVNTLLFNNYNSFSDDLADFRNQPNLFSDDAPSNGTYFRQNDADGLSGVHPTDAGANLIAVEVTKAINRLIVLSKFNINL